jgi:hypothetical protein
MDIATICSQTNYTEVEAQAKLELLGDPIQVIRDYLRPVVPKPVVAAKDANQMIYQEIGKFMEDKYRTVGR